ncbi:glycosyltransferase family 2 protein [Candidatus Gottesmanbacteria bacterium]|nr:glycosyltransferase family 2 protein [Candidatus Gottesmanbacteria bacterium]
MQKSSVNPELSVIIPVYNEEQSLPILHKELISALEKIGYTFEILYVDDGSTDRSQNILRRLTNPRVHLITFRANFGKSEALAVGFRTVKGRYIITMDADLQDDPTQIKLLLDKLICGYDLVSGWRVKREDTKTKKISSFLFNRGTSLLSGVNLHDANCGLKIFTKEVADQISLYGELHRFIPILAAKKKFRVAELPIHHRKRKFGVSKYGWERGWRGIIDLFTTLFVTDYATKPAHFFGKIGLLLFIIGFIMDGYVTALKIFTGTTQGRIPLFLAGILCMVLGVQLLSTGLIAEMMTYYFLRRNPKTTPGHGGPEQ